LSENGKSRVASDNRKPSTIADSFWLYAFRKKGTYPKVSDNSGKWLMFMPLDQLDELWEKIKRSTEEGQLGSSSKVATAKQNPNATDSSTKVICVYTYDWTDRQDVMRIRGELRKLGVTSKIPYKADEDTYAGKYAKRGNQRISKYYE
jgi:hypothetical protein